MSDKNMDFKGLETVFNAAREKRDALEIERLRKEEQEAQRQALEKATCQALQDLTQEKIGAVLNALETLGQNQDGCEFKIERSSGGAYPVYEISYNGQVQDNRTSRAWSINGRSTLPDYKNVIRLFVSSAQSIKVIDYSREMGADSGGRHYYSADHKTFESAAKDLGLFVGHVAFRRMHDIENLLPKVDPAPVIQVPETPAPSVPQEKPRFSLLRRKAEQQAPQAARPVHVVPKSPTEEFITSMRETAQARLDEINAKMLEKQRLEEQQRKLEAILKSGMGPLCDMLQEDLGNPAQNGRDFGVSYTCHGDTASVVIEFRPDAVRAKDFDRGGKTDKMTVSVIERYGALYFELYKGFVQSEDKRWGTRLKFDNLEALREEIGHSFVEMGAECLAAVERRYTRKVKARALKM